MKSGVKSSRICTLFIILVALFGIPAKAGLFDEIKKSVEALKDTVEDVVGINDDKETEKTSSDSQTSYRNASFYEPVWVREIQQRLTDLGFNPGPVDGDFGGKTRDAIKAFERSRGLAVTGLPTPSVMSVLRERSQTAVIQRLPAVSVAKKQPTTITVPSNGSIAWFDPFAPGEPLGTGGISIGMEYSEAESVLTASGYEKKRQCYFIRKKTRGSILIRLSTRSGRKCQGDLRVSVISYQSNPPKGIQVPSVPDMLDRFKEHFGKEDANCTLTEGITANCWWRPPSALPLIKESRITYLANSEYLSVTLNAVDDLESRVSTSPKTGSTVTRDNRPGDQMAFQGSRTIAPAQTTVASGTQISFDPLAPGGIYIGMAHSEANLKLAENGYKKMTGACNFRSTAGGGRTDIVLAVGEYKRCMNQLSVSYIRYTRKGNTDVTGPPRDVINRLNKRLDAEANCKAVTDKIAICEWEFPPRAPLVKKISLQYVIGELTLGLEGVSDLAARLESGPTEETPMIGDIDPLEPEGVAIGMPAWQVASTLKSRGYKNPGACEFKTKKSGGSITMKMRSVSKVGICPDEKVIRSIIYTAYNAKVANSLVDVVARMNERIGMEPTRCKTLTVQRAECRWQSPPAAPLVSQVYLIASKSQLTLSISAVPNLEARVTPPPQPASTRDLPWWESELATESQTPQFEFSNKNARLTSDVRRKIRIESQTVYDYCKGRGIFSDFHNCSCVAQQFMERRVRELTDKQVKDEDIQALDNFIRAWNVKIDSYDSLKVAKAKKFELEKLQRRQKAFFSGDVNQNDLIAMADETANVCPNKAGAASYAYRKCVSLYKSKLQDALEAFCICYADRFSVLYMEAPRGTMNNITGIGSKSLLSCSKEISPNPLSR